MTAGMVWYGRGGGGNERGDRGGVEGKRWEGRGRGVEGCKETEA